MKRLRPINKCSPGFAYLSLLIAIAIIGIAAAASFQVGSILQRRAAEEELLAIGSEFRAALLSYSSSTPAGQASYPPSLESLLKDPRYPSIHRHLRKLYFDPLTGNQKWGTVMSPDGKGIIGIYSLAPGTPIKTGNFDLVYQSFTDKTTYADWIFTSVLPKQNVLPGKAALPGVPLTPTPATGTPAPLPSQTLQ